MEHTQRHTLARTHMHTHANNTHTHERYNTQYVAAQMPHAHPPSQCTQGTCVMHNTQHTVHTCTNTHMHTHLFAHTHKACTHGTHAHMHSTCLCRHTHTHTQGKCISGDGGIPRAAPGACDESLTKSLTPRGCCESFICFLLERGLGVSTSQSMGP